MKKYICDMCDKEYPEKDAREVYIKFGATDDCPPDGIEIDLCPKCRIELYRKYTGEPKITMKAKYFSL